MRTFLKISSIPTQKEIYGILSNYEPQQFTALVFELLKDLCSKRQSESRGIIIDSTDINLNWHAKKSPRKAWKTKNINGAIQLIEVSSLA